MGKRLTILFVAVLALALAANAPAQSTIDKIISGEPVGKYLSAVSTDVAMVCRYIGAAAGGGEITVAAGGDISLTVATVADTTTECPISGAYGGIIDVSDASCDTMGEVVNAINYGGNWRCALVNALSTDSSDNTLAAMAISTADSRDGRPLLWDTAVALHMTQAIIPSEDLGMFMANDSTTAPLAVNPFRDSQAALSYFSGTVTTAGAATISVYSVKQNVQPSAINAAGTGFTGLTETITTLLSIPGGATTVEAHYDGRYTPILGKKGEKLVVRESATASLTVPLLSSFGYYFKP